MVIADNHITTSLAATGEIITEHYIDTARDYQNPTGKRSPTPRPKTRKTGTPEQKQLRCRFVNDVATDLSSMSRLMTMAEDVGFEPTRGVNPARVPGV